MKLPLYTHPTLTVLVDDGASLPSRLAARPQTAQPCKAFDQAGQALQWLLLRPRHAGVPLRANHDLPGCGVTVDAQDIGGISRRRERFDVPSVVVVDFYLQGMNGLDFCRALQYLPCKKILLAGPAEERIAIDALNSGLVDRYVRKHDSDALSQLEQQICALRQAWFLDQERVAHKLLSLHDYSFLQCDAVAGLIGQLSREHGFVEHYLFPQPSGVLLIDGAGKARLMVVETERGMRAQYEVARDSGAPRSLLDALEQRRLLPFFPHAGHDGMYARAVGGRWHDSCRPPHVLHGEETYYWALFDLPQDYLREPPYTYTDHLRDMAADGATQAKAQAAPAVADYAGCVR